MNAATFLTLVITTIHAVKVEVGLLGSFTCSLNNDQVTLELWEWDPLEDDKLSSKTVPVGERFYLSGVDDEWCYIQPYLIIRHRCNFCGGDAEIIHHFGNLQKNANFTFYDFRLDNLGSFSCFKFLWATRVPLYKYLIASIVCE